MKFLQNNYKNIILGFLSSLAIYPLISLYINNKLLNLLIFLLLLLLFGVFYKKSYSEEIAKLAKKWQILALLISLILVLGYSYNLINTGNLVWGNFKNFLVSVVKVIGFYYLIKTIIYYLLKFLKTDFKESPNKLIVNYKKHPFLYSFLFLSICYGIFLVCYYPGIINYDNANQIKEVLGIHTRYLDAINPISDSTLTNFNPIIHTLLLGGLVKFGITYFNFNFGLFLYTMLQMLICIIIYSYCLSYSIKENIKTQYAFAILLILGFIPLFGFYSITAVKDTLYTAFLVLFSLQIYQLLKKEKLLLKDFVFLFLISMLVCLFRNNGFFIIILTLPFLCVKKEKLGILIVLFMTVITNLSFNNILLPKLGISGTSIRETLSVPFQQTARLAKLKPQAFSARDKKIIAQILDYDNLASDYNENLADPVKNKFNKDYKTEDLIQYFGVWSKGLINYPLIYIDATINNISSYFYPFEGSWKVYHKLNIKLPEAGFNYHYNNLKVQRDLLHTYEIIVECSPVGIILNIAIITWSSVLIFINLCNKKRYYIFMIPNIISILFCILSPANTYYRYIYPSLLIMVCLFPIYKNLCEKKN